MTLNRVNALRSSYDSNRLVRQHDLGVPLASVTYLEAEFCGRTLLKMSQRTYTMLLIMGYQQR